MSKVRKTVIPVAGLGTRFLPVTKTSPKELLPIGTTPTLQFVIEEAADSGIEEIILVTNPRKFQITEYFRLGGEYEEALKKLGKLKMLDSLHALLKRVKIIEAIQDAPHGLGHAIHCAKKAVNGEPFVIQLPDEIYDSSTPCVRQLIDVYEKMGSSVNATAHSPREEIQLYGIHNIASSEGGLHKSKGVVEKPHPDEAPSDLCVAGRYLFTPDIFEVIENTPPGANGEIQLADAMNTIAKEGNLYAYEFEGKRFDTGDKLGYIKANIHFGFRDFPNELKSFITNADNGYLS
ncbi:MAG: UTP--glucose-1-phosphate uridylyltransferase [Pseudomonadota bacterium]